MFGNNDLFQGPHSVKFLSAEWHFAAALHNNI